MFLLLPHAPFPAHFPSLPNCRKTTGVYSESNFLMVHCTCAARCSARVAPQCYGLEEWVQTHAGLQEALPDSDDALEQVLRREVQVLLDGHVGGRKVRVGLGVVALRCALGAALHQGSGQYRASLAILAPRVCNSMCVLTPVAAALLACAAAGMCALCLIAPDCPSCLWRSSTGSRLRSWAGRSLWGAKCVWTGASTTP
jgi:hypothetical protein